MTSPTLVSPPPEIGHAPDVRGAAAPTLRARVLDALARQSGPSTTTELRAALDQPGCHPVVIERVYAVLVALERKGLVHRCTNSTGTRPVWVLGPRPPAIDTTRSHTMHCTVPYAASPRATAAPLTTRSLEERIARIETTAHARDLAEVILDPWQSSSWQRWKPLTSAPLAGWLYTARRVDASSRVDWILRALAHRARWSHAARDVTQDGQLHESLRSVSRMDDRHFADLGWMLTLALFPWSSCVSATVPTPTAGDR